MRGALLPCRQFCLSLPIAGLSGDRYHLDGAEHASEPLLSLVCAAAQGCNGQSVCRLLMRGGLRADGMRMDLVKSRYNTFDELYEYCYKVAGTVGASMSPCPEG